MKQGERLQSLDALRGFNMCFIMGLAGLITAICALFPGGEGCWLAGQMEHAEWEGFFHHDTIFPLFLFLAGVSFPFSYAKQQSKGMTRGSIYLKIFKRGVILVILGMVYNGLLNCDFENLRYFSVLGRIGLAWMFAALLFMNTNKITRLIISIVILVGYSLLLSISAPDVMIADSLSMEGNIVGYIDRTLFGSSHLYREYYDPEGLLSVLPAIVTALLGMFAGELVREPENKVSGSRKTLILLGSAALLLNVGFIFNHFQPCNKALWNSAFVMFAGCYSCMMMAIFYWIIDVKQWRKWTFPFVVVGMNSITIYLAQAFISFDYTNNALFAGVASLLSEGPARVLMAAGYLLLCWLFLYFLYKKKVFLKV